LLQELRDQIFAEHPGYQDKYDAYDPDPVSMARLAEIENPINVLLFMGGWCADCRVQVPRFLRVLSGLNGLPITVRTIEVDQSKKDDEGLSEKHQVMMSPTFIVFQNGEELGRIIETPTRTMEEDLVDIIFSEGK